VLGGFSKGEERAEYDRRSRGLREVRKRAADGRTGADNVTDDGDSPILDDGAKRRWKSVMHGKQLARRRVCQALGVDEIDTEAFRHQQSQEGPFDERAADDLGPVSIEPRGELLGQGPDGVGRPEQQLEVEPAAPVVAGLEGEVPEPLAYELGNLIAHRAFECTKQRRCAAGKLSDRTPGLKKPPGIRAKPVQD
jgi:hypothetical protein